MYRNDGLAHLGKVDHFFPKIGVVNGLADELTNHPCDRKMDDHPITC